MKIKLFNFLIVSFFLSNTISSQNNVLISKKEFLNKVKENNSSLKISKQNYLQAQANYKQTSTIFLPNITASHTGFITTNPLMAFGSKLNQGILIQADFNPLLLNNPKRTQNFATKIEIQQPILNIDGLYKRKAAKTKMVATSLQIQRTKDFLLFEAEKLYMQLQLSYKNVYVLKKSLEAAKANLQVAENSLEQGYLQRADILAIEVQVTEVKNQLYTANNTIENISNHLSFLANETQNNIYQPADSLEVKPFNTLSNKTLPDNRSDLKAMQLTSETYKKIHTSNKMSFLPTLNAFGSYELYDNKIFSANSNGYLIGAQLSWNIFKGAERYGKIQGSKAAYEKSKLEYHQYKAKSELELNKTKRILAYTEKQLNLTKLALKQSSEALRIRKNRFKEGLEKTSDLLIAETQYAQKQLLYYQTVYQYNYTKAYLIFLTKE
ncbi:TolC family protein [Tenacibaculum halocynthiae]|uniref:TolC family protein n=1 Tax=Tenacibaculum halocynthiae TaxID=1254437 RepID=UPI003D6484D1